MTSSNGNIFRVTGHLCGEFTGPGEFPAQRPVTRSFDVFFDLHPNKRLKKQWWGWWFETQSWPLWRHRNDRVTSVRTLKSNFVRDSFIYLATVLQVRFAAPKQSYNICHADQTLNSHKTPIIHVARPRGSAMGCRLGVWWWTLALSHINTLRPKQNGRHFADDTFKRIFLNLNVRYSIKISLKFVP